MKHTVQVTLAIPTLSVAVCIATDGGYQATVPEACSGAVMPLYDAGQETTGASLSFTVRINEHESLRPEVSVALQNDFSIAVRKR